MSVIAQRISADQALAVAQADAQRTYRDLTPFAIRLSLEADGWHVDYELKDPRWKGGGPHYVLDAGPGDILWRRSDQ